MELTPIKANCTELKTGNYLVLFSYQTPVAYRDLRTGKYYRTVKKWSRTTSRHISQWLNGQQAEEVGQDNLDQLIQG